jgi:hypothetical protein
MPKKAAPKANSTLTKSDLIRSMPAASAAAIIAKAKQHGLKLTANHVYAVRAIDKRRAADKKAKATGAAPAPKAVAAAKAPVAAPARKPGRPKKVASVGQPAGSETHFMALVLDLGLAKAEALLHRVRERVRDL